MGCDCKLRNKLLKREIQLGERDVYLDYSATTKPDIETLYELEQANRIFWGNPSSQNSRGALLYNKVKTQSDKLLSEMGLKDYSIYFDTSSSAIACKLATSNSKVFYTKATSHSSLDLNNIKKLPVDSNDKINKDYLRNRIEPGSILLYSPVNHEIGSLDDYKDIYKITKSRNVTVIFDAVQMISKVDINNWKDYCDGFYFSGHKIHSPPGAAALILKKEIDFKLPISKTLDFSLYNGTFNTPAVLAFLKSIDNHLKDFSKNYTYLSALTKDAYKILEGIKREITIETPSNNVPGIINFSIRDIELIEELLLHLNRSSIYVSRFSACTGELSSPSDILKKLGRSGDSINNSIRISFGKYSKRGDFYSLVNSINDFIRI